MSRRYLAMLIGLALIWGASFMFIKVAVRELDAGDADPGAARARGAHAGSRRARRDRRTDDSRRAPRDTGAGSSVVALVNTADPVLAPLLGRDAASTRGSRRSSRRRCRSSTRCSRSASSARCASPASGSSASPSASSESRSSSAPSRTARCSAPSQSSAWRSATAIGGLLAGRHLRSVSPLVVALASTSVAAVARAAGRRSLQAPHHCPAWKMIASVVALGVPGTALAYLLFFAMIAGAGAALRVARDVSRSRRSLSPTARSSSASASARPPSAGSRSSSAASRSAPASPARACCAVG